MKMAMKATFALLFVILMTFISFACGAKPITVAKSKDKEMEIKKIEQIAEVEAKVKYEEIEKAKAEAKKHESKTTTSMITPLVATEKNPSEIKNVDNFIAVFDISTTGKVDKDVSQPLTDRVINEFSKSDKYDVIDRGNMNKILGEQKFQMSGCVAQECKVEAGQLLGVGKIVTGSVGIVGKTYYLTLQLINVKTGKVEVSADDECKCEIDELLGTTRRLAKKLLSEKVEQPAAVPTPATILMSKQPERQLTTGANTWDGRFIAYSNGTVLDTNTNLIWAAKDNGSEINWPDAKSYCENYRGGGYADWRMPTQSELEGLYDVTKTSKSDLGIDVHITELIRLSSALLWASEYSLMSGAAVVSFIEGGRYRFSPVLNINLNRVLPVRSGK